MRRSISAVGAIVGVLALGGCGDAKEKQYRREANAICTAAAKQIDALPKSSSLAKVAEREIDIRRDVIAKLGELSAPKNISGGAGDVLADQEARQERARAMMKAVKDKDEKELREIRHEGKIEYKREAGRADAFGLSACAEL